jgi:hypothetical protein
MFQATGDVSMRRDHARPRVLDHALDAVVRQQGENDNRRRPLFDDATRRQAAVYEEKSLDHSKTHLGFLPASQATTDVRSNRAAREEGPGRGASGGESDMHFRARHRLALVGEATANQIMGVTVPFAPALGLTRAMAAYAGFVDGRNPLQPDRAQGAAIGNSRHDSPLGNTPDREAGNNPIAQLDSKYTAPVHGQHDRIVSARDTLTSNQFHPPVETGADEREFLPDRSQGRAGEHGFVSSGIAYPAARADGMITNDLIHELWVGASTIGAGLGGFGEMIGQGDRRANPGNSHPTVDRDGGSRSDDGLSSDAATSGAVRDAMAAAADELERLRAAVRRTIDELESARSSVQPPLPSLPVNRGTFRIS